ATPRQQSLLQSLQHLGSEVTLADFLNKTQTTRATVQRLQANGWLAVHQREVLRGQESALPPDQPKLLTPDQAQALGQIQALSAGETLLLWGVTGSGKTEVYLQAIQPLLTAGKSALVLVPEIGLTPQLTERFQRRFPGQVWVYHSALSQGERYDCWRQMLTGGPQVVIGTRSAVFVPLPKLGLIILDEEHDASYKQDRPAPSYHARTVAQWRSVAESCPLVLGSATPDLESYQAATDGTYTLAQLPVRVGGAGLPTVMLVDLREELAEGNYSPLSRTLQREIQQMMERKEQGILFLNRRGFHTFILCRGCGEVLTCPNCTVSLTYHLSDRFLRCHHCHYRRPEPEQTCPQCGSTHYKFFGTGTQRIETAVQERFPGLRVARFDRDTTQRKGSHREILDQFGRGETDLLIGTQMLTKGLDLPRVTLVGILAADSLLNMPDFRCTERAFQLLTQVAGRGGRGDQPGRVILQTYNPTHAVVEAARTHDFLQFAEPELIARRAQGFPPFGRLVRLGWQGPVEELVLIAAQTVARYLQEHEQEILGPAPALIPKVRLAYRWQLLWKLPLMAEPQHLLQALMKIDNSIFCHVDIDPIQAW
ncbi:primosomal protein N', partial [Candidatus Cyanaurora vandensis]